MGVKLGATELLAPTPGTRRFATERLVRLGDVDVRGRLRLDATARFLQDIASDDVAEVSAEIGLDSGRGWMVRRTLVEVRTAAVLDERLELETFCTGSGKCWAERSTTLRGAEGADVSTVSLWVQIATDTGRPAPLGDLFLDVYGPPTNGRKVSSRLSLPGPISRSGGVSWMVRRADLDPFDHVNNAANWSFLEEVLDPEASRAGRAEMEFVAPVTHGTAAEMVVEQDSSMSERASTSAWLVEDDRVLSAARWTPA